MSTRSMEQMSGLEILQTFLLGGEIAYEGISKTLGFTMTSVEAGRAVFAGTPGVAVYNPLGTVHGGYAATLLDSAMGCAVHSALKPGQSYTTLEFKVAYHKAMSADTGRVEATGMIVSIGRRVAFAESKLTDASGRVLASATSTLLITERQGSADRA
ncbi:MAG: PaaI family thioesterase [Solirubrobacteraceae bacterium]